MIVDCIADLHGHYPKLEGGDLLIVAGDLTATDSFSEYSEFMHWLWEQNYVNKVFIAGNHDNKLESYLRQGDPFANCECEYLCDSGTEFEYWEDMTEENPDKTVILDVAVKKKKTLKIWGSPWTPYFEGVNPRCSAFMKPDDELQEYWEKIPDDTDILITHGPMYGVRDKVGKWNPKGAKDDEKHAGSKSLLERLLSMKNLKYHIFGHIHEGYGLFKAGKMTFVNCSHVDENYIPGDNPIRIKI